MKLADVNVEAAGALFSETPAVRGNAATNSVLTRIASTESCACCSLSLAEVFIKEHKNAEAAGAYQHVLDLVPDHIEALRGLGDLALLEERLDAAAARYGRILAVDPGDAGAMTKLGVLKMRGGHADEAMAL